MSKYVIEKGLPIPDPVRGPGMPRSPLTTALLQLEPGDSLDFRPKKPYQVRALIKYNCSNRKFAIRGTRVWRIS